MNETTNHSDIMIELTDFTNDASQKRAPFLAQPEGCVCNPCSSACNCTCTNFVNSVAPTSDASWAGGAYYGSALTSLSE
jgi:hypothetical protein